MNQQLKITNESARQPFLSICIPTYNRSENLKALLSAITKQDNNYLEVIVSDNGSTDNTQTVVKEYQKKIHCLKYFRNEKNLGFDFNILQALEKANGQYCWTIGDDDLPKENAVAKLIKIIKKNSQCAFFLMNYELLLFGKPKPKTLKCIFQNQDIYFKTGQEFFRYRCKDYWKIGILGVFAIAVFAAVYNRKYIEKSLLQDLRKKYNYTFLIHLALILNIIAKKPVYFIHQPLITSSPATRFSRELSKNDVYLKHLPKILNDAKKMGYGFLAISKIKYYYRIRISLLTIKQFLDNFIKFPRRKN